MSKRVKIDSSSILNVFTNQSRTFCISPLDFAKLCNGEYSIIQITYRSKIPNGKGEHGIFHNTITSSTKPSIMDILPTVKMLKKAKGKYLTLEYR